MEAEKSKMGAQPRLSDVERRRRFFYAEAEADLYDSSADLNTPHYSLMHATLLDLVERHVVDQEKQGISGDLLVLDVGSGTGAESLSILQRFPQSRIVALDLCEPMHEIFRGKLRAVENGESLEARCRFVLGDVVGREAEPEQLRRVIAGWGRTSFDVVISALTLHHLTTPEKALAYARLRDVLGEGGLLLNADVFSYQSPTMRSHAERATLDWIERQFTEPDAHLRPALRALGGRAGDLMSAWLDHCVKYNRPDPVESPRDGTEGAIGGDGSEGQAAMLREVGFREVACPFRYYQIGILWAIR